MAEVVVFDIDAASAIQKLVQLRESTLLLKEEQKKLAEQVKAGNATSAEAAKSYEANTIILKNVQNEQRNLSRQVEGYAQVQKDATDTTNFANNSIQQNRDLLKQLTAQYINLKNPSAEATNQIKTLSNTLKQQEGAIGDARRNVGNYEGALKDAVSEIQIFGVSLGSLNTTFNTYKAALVDAKVQLAGYITGQKAADGATKASIISTAGLSAAMNVLRLALIATGIGAFVVLLGSLVAAFATTERGADLLEDAIANVTGVFKALFGEAQKLGVQLINIFSNPKKAITDLITFLQGNLVNRLQGFKVVLDGILERDTKKITNGIAQIGTGVENLTDKLEQGAKNAGKFLSDAAKKQQQIVKIQRELEDLEGAINKRRAETATRETELLIIAKSVNSTQKERKAATDEILKNTADLQKLEEDIVNKKIEALKLTQSQTITDKKGNKELQDLEAELLQVQAAGKEKQLSLIKLLNKQEKDENKATKEELKKTEFDLIKFYEQVRKEELEKTLNNLKINTEQQELVVKEQYANGIINKQQYEAELQRIGLESYDAQIIALSDYGEQIIEKEIERQNAILDQTIINNEKAKELSQELIDQELINQQIIQDARIEGVNGLIQIAQIAAGENQKLAKIFLVAEKAVAIAEIIINLQRELSANATVAAANPLNAATLGAAGAAQLVALNTLSKVRAGIGIATIAATTIKDVALPKKAEGGEIEIDGKSHSQGGEVVTVGGKPVAEVEGGEGLFVMKKNAYQAIKQYSNINKAFGGKSWNTTSSFLQDGGAINTTLPRQTARIRVNEQIEQNRQIVRALSSMPAPELSIVELDRKTAKRNKSVRVSEL